MVDNHLKPILDHNRREFERLGRRRWQFAAVAMVGIVIVTVVLPKELWEKVWWPAWIFVCAVFVLLEIRRGLVFKRDLRERKEMGDTEGG